MKTLHIATVLVLALGLTAGFALAESTVVSGPQVDQKVPGPFHPLNVTGDKAGEKNCLYCQNGTNPVAMVFAREVTPEVTKLIKKLDGATCSNEGCSMGSFVVFLSDNEEGLAQQLKSLAKENDLKKIILSIDNPAGPKNYKIAKGADVTVVLYTNHTVKANFAFKKGQLSDKDIDTIVSDIPKITK
jgi:hypothetical protein